MRILTRLFFTHRGLVPITRSGRERGATSTISFGRSYMTKAPSSFPIFRLVSREGEKSEREKNKKKKRNMACHALR